MHTLLFLLSWGSAAVAQPRTVTHLEQSYRVVTVDLREQALDLVGQGSSAGLRTFAAVRAHYGDDLIAATNAGIFHTPERPVGLFVAGGREHHRLETGTGAGNFYLRPNAVFDVGRDGARVVDTVGYRRAPGLQIATQSGPALVLDGEIHPVFDPESRNRLLRSGVGVRDPHTVVLAISEEPVRFHDFATLFRDVLGCNDALYLDGVVSGLAARSGEVPGHTYAGLLVVADRKPTVRGVRDGDVVFHRSTSSQADAIAVATGSRYTHMGIVRIVDGAPMVLEAVQPVRLTPLAEWRSRGRTGTFAARRHPDADVVWTKPTLERLDALQAEWLGRSYDARFEWDDARLYCSELVHKAFGAAGVELAPLRTVASYGITDRRTLAAIRQRWGRFPAELEVIAPSDLYDAVDWQIVEP